MTVRVYRLTALKHSELDVDLDAQLDHAARWNGKIERVVRTDLCERAKYSLLKAWHR